MTLAAACGWSLARSLAVAILALPTCRWLCRWLRGMPERQRRLAWIMLVVPFLCPELWTGYAWSGFAVRMKDAGFWELFPKLLFAGSPTEIVTRDAAVDEVLLDILLFFRALPVGTLALYFAPPPPLSAEALYCRKLVVAKSQRRRPFIRDWLGFALGGRWHGAFPAFALIFLVCFQEFELASLIVRPAWTVWLFDAQVGGLALNESLRRALWPVIWQVAIAAPLILWVVMHSTQTATRHRHPRPPSAVRSATLWCLALASVIFVCVVPIVFIGQGTFEGLARVSQNTAQFYALLREIFIGMAYALAATLASAMLAAWFARAAQASRLALAGVVSAAIPGLFGSLVLGLALIELLQQPYIRVLYKTPLALVSGMTLFLMPRAIVLRLLLWLNRQPSGLHLASLLHNAPSKSVRDAASELGWQMRWRGEVWGGALLAWWAFLDLTIVYLLAPVTIVSAPVMLYNQMHFGKNSVLSALVFLTAAVPALSFATALAGRRFLFRWFRRLSLKAGTT